MFYLLLNIGQYNPNKDDNSFKNKVSLIHQVRERQAREIYRLVEAKKNELPKGLSPKRIKEFMQFEADESHV